MPTEIHSPDQVYVPFTGNLHVVVFGRPVFRQVPVHVEELSSGVLETPARTPRRARQGRSRSWSESVGTNSTLRCEYRFVPPVSGSRDGDPIVDLITRPAATAVFEVSSYVPVPDPTLTRRLVSAARELERHAAIVLLQTDVDGEVLERSLLHGPGSPVPRPIRQRTAPRDTAPSTGHPTRPCGSNCCSRR